MLLRHPWGILKKCKQLAATKVAAYMNQTVLVYAVNPEDAFGEIDTHCGKL